MRPATGFRRAMSWLPGLLLTLLMLGSAGLLYFGIPQNAAGMAAKGICSAAFVAGRPRQDLMAQDVLPASPVLALISVTIDEATHSASARFAGLFERRAVLLTGRGCVLGLEPDPAAKPYTPTVDAGQAWPMGEAALPSAEWTGVDKSRLEKVADDAFIGAGDPLAGNARGLAVVQHGRLLVLRNAPGFAPGTGLHGWSMSKTVTGMLAYKLAADTGLALDSKVVDAFPPGRAPASTARPPARWCRLRGGAGAPRARPPNGRAAAA